MKIRFKELAYQKDAVQAVVDCFVEQPWQSSLSYMMDRGIPSAQSVLQQANLQPDLIEVLNQRAQEERQDESDFTGFANAPIRDWAATLRALQSVQLRHGLPVSEQFILDDERRKNLTGSPLNLNIEMETGTGKTYCYIRTMFELYKQYGWSKFIVVVPSIAIREGVQKSFSMMAEHFQQIYGHKARFFTYDSKALHHLESFSSDAGLNVMIINVQAFNATGKDNRRIYEVLDEFQSRRPIDVISRNHPILIMDEPQKMGAKKTLESLSNFKPLFILRYSATHKRNYNLIYRLDALDAYNQKLVKKITVKGIETKGLSGAHGYLYLQEIVVSKSAPVARLELEVKMQNGFKRVVRKVKKGDNLYVISNESEQYADRFVVSEIDVRDNSVEFVNGLKIHVGEAIGHVDEKILRTIQIRETVRAHIQKERQLFSQGIKVLSLFFIDEVAKYRQYDEHNNAVDGEYAQIFKEQYLHVLNEEMELNLENDSYLNYLQQIQVDHTHNGYFSIDKRSKRLVDPALKNAKDEELGVTVKVADDTDAYDLILKDKERLLSFEEPTRFIFSHSALREGWDNPNVFVICTLKHSDNVISRRQEVGRGMRLAVNKLGERMDANYFQGASGEIHKLNNLTVIANESYSSFVACLQDELAQAIANRPQQATQEYFKGKVVKNASGKTLYINEDEARLINKHLYKHDYIDGNDNLTVDYQKAKEAGTLVKMPLVLEEFSDQIYKIVDAIVDPKAIASMTTDANKQLRNPINQANLARKEFQALWKRINRGSVFQIQLDTNKLKAESIKAIDKVAQERGNSFVETLHYKLVEGTQKEEVKADEVRGGESFGTTKIATHQAKVAISAEMRYDLLGNIAEGTSLTRKTVAHILSGIDKAVFLQFKYNPEAFIREIVRLVNEQQAKLVIQGLTYDLLAEGHRDNEIFVTNESIPSDSYKAQHHVWDYVVTDSANERYFVQELDKADEVAVYAKLPDRFQIPTPLGNYNPDWAIAFKREDIRHVYFIAETKGSTDESSLREVEKGKIESAKRFVQAINQENQALDGKVVYDVIDGYESLMKLVGG